MILITYTRLELATSKKQLDFVKLDSLDDIWGWLDGLGGQLVFQLTNKKKVLTPQGFKKCPVPVPNVIQIISEDENTLFNVEKIICERGILFSSITHCSEELVDYIALKCEIRRTQ
jgi:hypothetical protein